MHRGEEGKIEVGNQLYWQLVGYLAPQIASSNQTGLGDGSIESSIGEDEDSRSPLSCRALASCSPPSCIYLPWGNGVKRRSMDIKLR